jgi:cyclase
MNGWRYSDDGQRNWGYGAVGAALLVLSIGLAPAAQAQDDMANVRIQTVPVADGLYMLLGQGGNMGLSTGDDGAFLVDDQFAPLTEKIQAAVAAVSEVPIRFVVNTHWHGDHTGGNENLGEAGALIVAHENVRARMSTEQFMEAMGQTVPPSPPPALPVVTFADAVTFHWNGEEIYVFHVSPGHTDGDAIIHFKNANAFHMGDTFFNGAYPFIDVSSGGSFDGLLTTVDQVLALADDQTKIIPGHGPLGDKEALLAYRNMLATVRDRIAPMVRDGVPVEDVVAAKPTSDLDAQWGGGFMQPDQWVAIVYAALGPQ